jgi:LmbE family N-acetylglucosaminyl deacetylase
MNGATPSNTTKPPLWRRAVRRLAHLISKPFKPVLHRMRDRQAPSLLRWMHEASVPIEPTRKAALVIAPHHDDETFGCGGMIALKRDAGVDVHVLVMTDGRQSHGRLSAVDSDRLAQTRRDELLQACGILGVPEKNVHLLKLPDQGVYRLTPEEQHRAATAVAALVSVIRPQELYVNHRNDRHPDHEAVFRVITDAIKIANVPLDVLQYPIWLIWKGPYRWDKTPQDLRGAGRLDVRSVRERKNRAIQVYASQLSVLPPGFVEQFMQGYEFFFRE